MPSKKNIQQKIREVEKQLDELKSMFKEHYKDPKVPVWYEIGKAWKDLNEAVTIRDKWKELNEPHKHKHHFVIRNSFNDLECSICGMFLKRDVYDDCWREK